MNMRRHFLVLVTLMVAHEAAAEAPTALPDLSGAWNHLSLNGLELPLEGPGPLTNLARRRIGPGAGAGDGSRLVGDYRNAILQPWAADVVKKAGEVALAGRGLPTPRNQCWPEQVPFVMGNFGMQILQQPDKVTILYPFDHQFRQVRLNASHPRGVVPSWYGDSVGRYEGDALVVDTIGVKVGPYSMVDWYGTPFTPALHITERYRRIPYESTLAAIERDATEHAPLVNPDNGPPFDPDYRGHGLQIHLTIDDAGSFTMPWTATVTLRRATDERLELVCADNPEWFPGTRSRIPQAASPDF